MSHTTDRNDFVTACIADGLTRKTALLVMRDAATIQRLAVEACNRSLTAREEKQDLACQRRVIARLAPIHQGDSKRYQFQGDPRGACVKVRFRHTPGNSFGGDGWYCVPAPNY